MPKRQNNRAAKLKATRIRRGITRRELDREREAMRRYWIDGHVSRGFTGPQLYAMATDMAHAIT